MKYLIRPATLKSLREKKRLSQEELYELSKQRRQLVGLATIKRIESWTKGEYYPATKTVAERLAKVFGVKVDDLAREPEDSNSARAERLLRSLGWAVRPIRTKVPQHSALSFDMVERRYGIPARVQVAMAPLFTALLAEASLQWRRERLARIREHVEALNGLGGANFSFLNAAHACADEGAYCEEQSISRGDVFGRSISEQAYDHGYDPYEENAFSFFLRDFVDRLPDADIELEEGLGRDGFPDFRVGGEEIRVLTNGNREAEYALAARHANIDDIPEDLLAEDKAAERAEWLVSRIPEKELRDLRAGLEIFASPETAGDNADKEEEGHDS